MATEIVVDFDYPLSAADRCDRCGAQAKTREPLPSGAELLFCGHHARQHRAALEALWQS